MAISFVKGEGNLFVDTVFSSSESRVTVDDLRSTEAVTGSTSSQQIEFEAYQNLAISAPFLGFDASFVSINVENDARFLSANDSISLVGGHDFNANSLDMTFLANDMEISSNGDLLLLARDSVQLSGADVNVFSQSTISFGSLAGSISINSSQAFDFQSDGSLSVRALEDLSFLSKANVIFTGSDDIYLTSEKTLAIDSSASISIASSSGEVRLDSHDLGVTLGSLSAVGNGNALLQSLGDEFSVYGFDGVIVSSFGDLNVIGETDGATFSSSGDGGVSIASNFGSTTFTAKGASDTSFVHLDASVVGVDVSDEFQVFSSSKSSLTGDNMMSFDASTISFDINRDAFVYNENKMSFSAGSSFGITADQIKVAATDDVTSSGFGTVSFSALTTTTAADDLLSITGGQMKFSAGDSGIDMNIGDDLVFEADFSDGRNQEMTIQANDIFFNGGDFFIKGGRGEPSQISGANTFMSSGSDWDITSISESQSSTVNFDAGNSATFNVDSWVHSSGPALFSPEVKSELSDFTVTANEVSFSSLGSGDISLQSDLSTFDVADSLLVDIGRDFVFTARSGATFNSLNRDMTLEASDFYASSNSLSILAGNGDSIDQLLTFSADNNVIMTSERNENSDDFISFDFSDEISISLNGDAFFNGLSASTINAGNIEVESDFMRLSSGPNGVLEANAGSFLFSAGDDVLAAGESVLFSSKTSDISLQSEDIDFIALARGVDFNSDSTFSLTVSEDFEIFAVGSPFERGDEVLFKSMDMMSLTSDSTQFFGDELLYLYTMNGDISFSTVGLTSLITDRNMTLSTGDRVGDSFLLDSSFFDVTSSFLYAVDVADGPLSISSSTGNVEFNMDTLSLFGDEGLTVTASNVVLDAGTVAFTGGNIFLQSVATDVEFISALETSLVSLRSSIGAEEFDGNEDGIQFTSNLSAIDIFNQRETIAFDSLGSISMETLSTAGPVTMDAADILISSAGENQDVVSTSGSTMTLETVNGFQIDASSDFLMTAGNALSFTQSNLLLQLNYDFSMISDDGSISVDHSGPPNLGVILSSRSSVQNTFNARNNFLQMDATESITVTSQNGISMISSGFSESRQNTLGDSNTHQEYNQVVGLSARTYEPEAHIIFDARSSPISMGAGRNMLLDSDQRMEITTLHEQSWSSSSVMSMEAEDGQLYFNAATGIAMDGGNGEANFMSHRYTDFIADRNIALTVEDDFDITSFHADISLTTFNAADVTIDTLFSVEYSAGSEMNFFSQGNLNFNVGDEFSVTGDRRYSLQASGDLVSFTSVERGNVVDSSEEIYIQAGGDLLLSNAGQELENMRFNGNGVVFTTAGGDMVYDVTGDISFSMENMLIHAFGTSVGGRDSVSFTTPDSSFSSSGNTFIDATETIQLGFDTNPSIISITTVNPSDISFTASGNIEFDIDEDFESISTFDFTSYSIAETSFTAGTSFDFVATTGDVSFTAMEGAISLSSFTQFTHTVTNGVMFSGGVQNSYSTGDIVFDVTVGDFTAQGEDVLRNLGDDYFTSVVAGNAIFTTSKVDGDMVFDIGSVFQIDSGDDFILSADDRMMFSAVDDVSFLVAALTSFDVDGGDSSMTFSIANEASFLVAVDISFTSDLVDFTSRSDDIEFETAAGFFIQNNSPFSGSTYIEALESIDVTVTEDATFSLFNDFLIVAENEIEFSSATLLVNSASVEVVTLPGGESDINFDIISTVDFSGPQGSLYVNAADEVDLESSVSSVFTSNQLEFISLGERADIDVDFTNSASFAYTDFTATAGDEYSGGNFEFSGTTLGGTISSIMDLTADARDVASTSSVDFSFSTSFTLAATTNMDFIAKSDVEEQQGTMDLSGDTFVVLDAADAFTVTSENAGIIMGAPTVAWVSQNTFSVNTDGQDSGISILGSTVTLPSFGDAIILNAGLDASFYSESTTIGTNTFDVVVNGQSEDGTGLLFRTDSSEGNIDITANSDLEFDSTYAINSVATNSLVMGSDDLFSMSASSFEFTAKGSDVSRTDGPFNDYNRGIFISADTFDVSSDNFIIESGYALTIETDSISFDATDVLFSSMGDIDIDVVGTTTFTSDDISVTASFGGVHFSSTNDLAIDVEDNIFVDVGATDDDSKLVFTSNAAGDFQATAEDDIFFFFGGNMITTGFSAIAYEGNDVNFVATKGDMLFRSISPVTGQINDLFITAGDEIVIDVFERIEHRQHDRLAFFNPVADPGRPADPITQRSDQDSATQQTTSLPVTFNPNGFRPNGCLCTNIAPFNCNNVECPDNTARILQMQDAFIDYGLLRVV